MASTAEGPTALTAEQTRALFDILTHHETYREIEGFKTAEAVTKYGFPFTRTPKLSAVGGKSAASTPAGTPRTRSPERLGDWEDSEPSMSPILQTLLTRFVLPLPGVRDMPRDFWAVRVQGLLARLGEAELSESYDKGALGTRKMLATGASGLIEMLGRGVLGGLGKTRDESVNAWGEKGASYDHKKGEELERAWNDVVEGLVYGDMVDDMCGHLTETDDLEGRSPAVKASAEYAIIHLATFIHHIFVLSPEGQYLLKLIENVHNLIPYKMLKQTLRVGNAATMISGMMRLLLAKLSVTSITNWVGLTANADDGMNLLQRIISLVLSWDAGEFRKSADKIERAKDRPSEDMLQAIRAYITQDRPKHTDVRTASAGEGQSIITAIFKASNPGLIADLTESKHAQCLEYYSALLSVRDRESITAAICRQPPDLFTHMIKDAVAAYEPMIRAVHSRVDLREHFEAMQGFLEDLIRASKPKKVETSGVRAMINGDAGKMRMASVDDYVDLLMRNRSMLYKWIHAVAAQCPDVWEEMRTWVKGIIVKFRQDEASATTEPNEKSRESRQAGLSRSVMEGRLSDLFQALPSASKQPVLDALSSHAQYLTALTALSQIRLQRIVDSYSSESKTSNMAGPGVYISRWQDLLDKTAITPGTPTGQVRYGKDVKNVTTMGKIGIAGGVDTAAREEALDEMLDGPEAPDVGVVVRELGEGFLRLVQEIGGPLGG